ncbi:MAG: FMN-binding negative transcriptional regulator [Betaproteobacteria bacterium]
MYLPAHFNEERVDVLHQLIQYHPLGTLVIHSDDGLSADHIPFLVDPSPAPFGTLRGHVARANPLWQKAGAEAMVVFQGPDAYVSPSWYPSKKEHGKVVPTWNYAVVHAHGTLRAIDDAVWLRDFLETLTQHFESPMPMPWNVSDAPADFIETLLRSIVGIEIPMTRLLGKWKTSQNRPRADREGVMAGLHAMAASDAGKASDSNAMADWVAVTGKSA